MNKISFAAACGLAAVALAQPAFAHGDHAANPSATAAGNSLVVVRDAESGQLRAATPEELSKLELQANRNQSLRSSSIGAVQAPMQKSHASGARGARVTDAFISMSVAVKKADGSVAQECFESPDEAQAALKSAAAQAKIANKLATE